MIVLDATVAVKLVTREPGAEAALARIIRESERLAPDWIRIEVASALAGKVRHNGLPQSIAIAALAQVDAFLTETVDALDLLDEAMALACTLKHAPYDCLYLSLAIRQSALVVTHDVKFVKAARRGGFSDHVELLA